MDKKLGKISNVDLRTVWKNEEYDFSVWLAEPENLALLSEEIGVDIQLVKREARVGNYSLDILAEEEATGRKIIIENQLEDTDHQHLGKIIMYAAGYNAEIIIWIFKDISEEYRQAIDWLNENTGEKIAFFGVKIELWQIGDSASAPKFQIISKPNEWAKIFKQGGDKGEITNTKIKQFEFWTKLKSYAQEKKLPIQFRSPRYQQYFDVSLGSADAHISLSINTKAGILSCVLYINDNKELFIYLESRKDVIEKELNISPLEWRNTEGKSSMIIEKRGDFDIENKEKMSEYFDWLLMKTSAFRRVFGRVIREYKQ